MRKALTKNVIRELIKTPGRFIAIFLIIAVSAGFYTGFGATGPSMKLSADTYYTQTRLADFRLLCDYGITDDDVATLRARPEVESVMPGYAADLLATNVEGTLIYSMFSLPGDTSEDNRDYLNRVVLQDGRMPEAADECLADPRDDIKIGDKITLDEGNDQDTLDLLAKREFTVVGKAQSPVYIALGRGNTTIGDGQVNYFIYVPETAFDSEYYTAVSLRLKDTADVSAFSDEYEEIISSEQDALEVFGDERGLVRLGDIRAEAEDELADAEVKYEKAKKKADKKLAKAKRELDDGRDKLADGEATYSDKVKTLEDAEKKIESSKEKLITSRAELEKSKKELQKKKTELQKGKTKLQKGKAAYQKNLTAYQTQKDQFDATFVGGVSMLPPEQAAAISAQLAGAKARLDAAKTQLDAAEKQITSGEKQLKAGEKQLADAEKKLADGEKKLADGEKEIADGKAVLNGARKTLNDSRAELADGQKKYDKAKKEADEKLEDAKKKIDDGRKDIEDLDTPEWFVMDREDNPEYAGFGSDADKINGLSLTIPSFMFLVAALVCLTTMTRMVEDQRMQIGTLKALGYRRRQIVAKYFFYSTAVSLLGGLIGVLFGLQIFPRAIWDAYSMLYTMGKIELAISLRPCLTGLFGGMVATTIATTAAVISELRSPAAELMRPKAPRAGKRVLLERVGIFWRRLRFNQKVTVRNLFRYKKRFIMTIIGVAGCTALLIAGFGIRDSIESMVSLQYGEIMHSEITVALREPSSATDDTQINKKLDGYGEYIYLYETIINVSHGHKSSGDTITYVYVPEDAEKLDEFITLKERKHKKQITFPPKNVDGEPAVVITEKLAKELGVVAGDEIRFAPPGEKKVKAKVAGIAESYIYNYVYIAPDDYKVLHGEDAEYASIMLETDSIEDRDYREILEDLVDTDNVTSAFSIEQVREMMDNMISSLNSVIWIIILVAGILALVVLYNLININIMERQRELATLKVLGFYPKEVYSYISRESILLTLIGIAFGAPCGVLLHRYIMESIEVSEVMFGRTIMLPSYLYAAVFTIFCVIAVNLLMRPKIGRIDPVGSLKSAE
ncbi:MAG: ABC transporter permease [Clostridiales Family XIII bacterium]|jgi:putative ABC transport system permease protein|nr:ABC transporter permease [Clostridiales Family XIII bacterium]